MKKQVIALQGKANSGKSASIRKLYDLLTTTYPKAQVDVVHPIHVDFSAIIEINGVLIGIESQGDPGSRLANSIETFKTRGCVIIICCTRTRGSTVVIVEALQPEFIITRHKKISGHDDDIMAQIILKQIRDLLES